MGAIRYAIILVIAAMLGWLTFLGLGGRGEAASRDGELMRAQKEGDKAARELAREERLRQGVGRISDWINRLFPMDLEERTMFGKRLRSAGLKASSAPFWRTIQVLLALACALITNSLLEQSGDVDMVRRAALPLALAIIGWNIPQAFFAIRASQRTEEIKKDLPNALDLMSAVCFAGCTLDEAMRQVAANMDGAFPDELATAVNDISLGVPRDVALRNLSDRCQIGLVTNFVTNVLEAQRTGLGIAGVLKNQASYIRTERSLEIEEKAGKLPVKMLPVMLLGMFSVLAIMIMSPYLGRLMDALASMAGSL